MSWVGMTGLVRLRTNGPSEGGPVRCARQLDFGCIGPDMGQIRRISGLGMRRDVG